MYSFTMANFQVALEWLVTTTMTTTNEELLLTTLPVLPEVVCSTATTENALSVLHVSGRIDPIQIEGAVYHVAVGHRCFASVSGNNHIVSLLLAHE